MNNTYDRAKRESCRPGSACKLGGCKAGECAINRRSTYHHPSAPEPCEFPVCAVHHICDRNCTRNAGVDSPYGGGDDR